MPAYWGLQLLLLGCAAAVPWLEIGEYKAAEWEWLAEEGLAAAVAAQAAMDVAVASESAAGLRQAERTAMHERKSAPEPRKPLCREASSALVAATNILGSISTYTASATAS